jgi:hypothetical protein
MVGLETGREGRDRRGERRLLMDGTDGLNEKGWARNTQYSVISPGKELPMSKIRNYSTVSYKELLYSNQYQQKRLILLGMLPLSPNRLTIPRCCPVADDEPPRHGHKKPRSQGLPSRAF